MLLPIVRTSVSRLRAFAMASAAVGTSALLVTRIQAAPAVDFPVAVGTPGMIWELPVDSGSGNQAFTEPNAAANGGSVGVLPFQSAASTRIIGPAILTTTVDQSPDFTLDGVDTQSRYVDNSSANGWYAMAVLVPAGEHELTIHNRYLGGGIRLDQVNVISAPPSLEDGFGLGEGSLKTGGSGWTQVPFLNLGKFAARATVTPTTPAWFDFSVTGPAEISCDQAYNGGWKLLLSVDGVETSTWGGSSLENSFRMEVPAGAHVVRFLAASPETGGNASTEFSILALRVAPVAAANRLVAAWDGALPVSTMGPWKVTSGLAGSENGSAIQAGASVGSEIPTLQTGFVGPGYLDFRWYAGTATDGSYSWMSMDADSGGYDRSFPIGLAEGWRVERVWFPPGPRRVEWNAFGNNSAGLSRAAVDGVHFTPSVLLGIDKALGVPSALWENDPQSPWIGSKRGAGSVVVSPELSAGSSSRLATTFTGPGQLSFRWNRIPNSAGSGEFRIDGKTVSWAHETESGETVTVNFPGPSAILAEWIDIAPIFPIRGKSRIVLDQVKWKAFARTSLAKSLDTPKSVKWTTSSAHSFTGLEDGGAVGGSSAYVSLKPGERAWLEAVVDGAGQFDFWLREVAGIDLSDNPWNYWSLEIDGKAVSIGGTRWPSLYISGPGKHRIRFKLNHPAGSNLAWLASAVDDVSWQPLEQVSLKKGTGLGVVNWRTSEAFPANGFATGGRDGDPVISLTLGAPELTWVSAKVEGPCEISWDSELGNHESQSAAYLRVDGMEVASMQQHPWQRMRLTLPKGNHRVRWSVRRAPNPDDEEHVFAAWKLSGFTLEPGVSELAKALDFPGLFALETGDAGGVRKSLEEGDAWRAGDGTSLYFFDPYLSGEFVTTWGHPFSLPQRWQYEAAGRYHELQANRSGWQKNFASMAVGNVVKWSYQSQPGQIPSSPAPMLKHLRFQGKVAVTGDDALDSATPLITDSWLGLPDPSAKRGLDSAWSLVNNVNSRHLASMMLTGPARVSFWWKNSGNGSLDLSVDGGVLPVPLPGGNWQQVKFDINSGTHEVRWNHAGTAVTSFAGPGHAYLDGLVTAAIPPLSLTEAVLAADAMLSISSAGSVTTEASWKAVRYQEAEGSWVRAGRAVGASGELSVMVNGPAVLEFGGRCFGASPEPEFASELANSGQSSVVIINPGFETTVLGHFLTGSVDGVEQFRIQDGDSATWIGGAMHVPAGVHQVTFRLRTWKSNLFREFIVDATDESLQGWIRGLHVVSPASRFDNWKSDHGISTLLDTDSDGDGAGDFLEYVFGTDPRDAGSIPPNLGMELISDGRTPSYRVVRLPYLPSHVSGVVQSSTDLLHWENESVRLPRFPPLRSLLILDQNPGYPNLPVPVDTPRKYYRIRISDDAE